MKRPQPIIGFYPMTDDVLVQRLLQMETTVKGLSSEIQRMKEEIMDQDTGHKNLEKLLHLKIKSRQNKFSILKLNCESKQHMQLQPPEIDHDQENMVNKHGTEGLLQAIQVLHGKYRNSCLKEAIQKPMNTTKGS